MYSFKSGDDIIYHLKSFSKTQSKHNKFEEFKNCLDGEEYQRECNKWILRSINHEMYLPKVEKNRHYLFWMIKELF